MYFSLRFCVLESVEADDLKSFKSSAVASYSIATSPAIVTLLFLVYGLITIESDLRSIILRFKKLSFYY